MLRILLCAATAGLVACAPTLRQRPPSPDDPSNPAAPEARACGPSRTLELTAAEAPAPVEPPADHHHHHPTSSDEPPAGDANPVKAVEPAGHDHHMPANDEVPAKATFVCPMHPEVTSDHEGQCPKCGMTLVPKKPRGQP